jgi:hypothetical protein
MSFLICCPYFIDILLGDERHEIDEYGDCFSVLHMYCDWIGKCCNEVSKLIPWDGIWVYGVIDETESSIARTRQGAGRIRSCGMNYHPKIR